MKKVSISINEVSEAKMKAIQNKFRYKSWEDFVIKMLDREYEKISK